MRPAPVLADEPAWATGVVYQVGEETYDDFFDMLPPRWISGSAFCFAEGEGPFRLFWKGRRDRCFARELSNEETDRFCKLAGVSRVL
jgi:hypothetical protein